MYTVVAIIHASIKVTNMSKLEAYFQVACTHNDNVTISYIKTQ